MIGVFVMGCLKLGVSVIGGGRWLWWYDGGIWCNVWCSSLGFSVRWWCNEVLGF